MATAGEKRPRISVIVPVYRVEDYLDVCVESVQRQSFTDWELILVDDGSPDGCGEICDNWAARDSRIQVIHQTNGGLSAARNSGVKAARGEWLAFLDSDDWWDPAFLEEMLQGLQESGAPLCICGWKYEYEKAGDGPEELLPLSGVLSAREVLMQMALPKGVVYVTAWNRLIRRDLWGDLSFPPGKLHEDEFVAHLLIDRADRVCLLDRPLVHYRQRGGSITAQSADIRHWDGTEALLKRFAYYENKGYSELLEPCFQGIRSQYFLCLREQDTDSSQGKNRLKTMQRDLAVLLKHKELINQLPFGERLAFSFPRLWKKQYALKRGSGEAK